jgi:hypothetical protein
MDDEQARSLRLLLLDEGSALLLPDEEGPAANVCRSDDPRRALSQAVYWELQPALRKAFFARFAGTLWS